MSIKPLKICRVCGGEFPAIPEHFYGDAKARDRLRTECKSCSREYRKTRHQENRALALLIQYRYRDKKKGLECDLTEEWIDQNIIDQPCTYCGSTTDPIGGDRIDNSIGHTRDNTVPSCSHCNTARNNNFTHDEMFLLGSVIRLIKRDRENEDTDANSRTDIINGVRD